MALQITLPPSSTTASPSLGSRCSLTPSASWPLNRATTVASLTDHARRVTGRFSRVSRDLGRGFRVYPVCFCLETAGPTVGQVTEVNKDTFWPLVKAAEPKIVVLDMYTQWCGPCKVIAPKIQELSEKYLDVVFLKLDCSQENKALAKELGIRVVPTFKILKDSKVVKEVTGAKLDDLVVAIDAAKIS